MAFPILDAHHHLWDLSVRDQPWIASQPEMSPLLRNFGLDDLAPLAAAAGVTATVIVQTVTEPGETPEMLELAATGSLVAAVVGWADLTAPDLADSLGELTGRADGSLLAGIRHPVLAEPDDDWLARPEVLRGLAAVADAGLSYDVVVRPAQLPAAVRAAAALPGLAFVLDHLGNVRVESRVDEQWAEAFGRFAALPNTFCKLSGILEAPAPGRSPSAGPNTGSALGGDGADRAPPEVGHLRPYYRLALDGFGPGRMMFGSDWPVSSLGAPYGDVVAAARALTSDLSEAEQAAIFGGTARRVYGIRTRGPVS